MAQWSWKSKDVMQPTLSNFHTSPPFLNGVVIITTWRSTDSIPFHISEHKIQWEGSGRQWWSHPDPKQTLSVKQTHIKISFIIISSNIISVPTSFLDLLGINIYALYLQITIRRRGGVVLPSTPPGFSPAPTARPVIQFLDGCGRTLSRLKIP